MKELYSRASKVGGLDIPQIDAQRREASELAHLETKNGFPVISVEDYFRFYNTDVREAGEDTRTTFNFQGYVRYEGPDYEPGVHYTDTLATNGLLKDQNQPGIHIGTNGIVSYHKQYENSRMRGPDQIGEYDIYLRIPSELQRKHKVVCEFDECLSEAEYIKKGGSIEGIENVRAVDYGHMVIRTGLEPKEDPLARAKAEVIHEGIVKFILNGGQLNKVRAFAQILEEALEELPPEEIAKHLEKTL